MYNPTDQGVVNLSKTHYIPMFLHMYLAFLHESVGDSREEGRGASGGPQVVEERVVDVGEQGRTQGRRYQQELQA